MHPLRIVCYLIAAVFLYVAGHLYVFGQNASQVYAPGYIAAEHDWFTTTVTLKRSAKFGPSFSSGSKAAGGDRSSRGKRARDGFALAGNTLL